jgi:hypothetical protein
MSYHSAYRLSSADQASLAVFTEEMFGRLPRIDQRRWAHAYLTGLLSVPGKKTFQQLAMTASAAPVTYHGLQQFINSSPWEWKPARQALVRMAGSEMPVRAWTVGKTIIPKRGEHSVGVHRRFITESGRTVNCQVAHGLFLSSAHESVAVDWRILLEGSWLQDAHRRRRARIPESVAARPPWAHLLDFADLIQARRLFASAPLVAAARCIPDMGPLIAGLARRNMDFVLQMTPSQLLVPSAQAASLSPGRVFTRPITAREFLTNGYARQSHTLMSQAGQERPRVLTAYCGLVHFPLPGDSATKPPRTYRLLAEWSPTSKKVTRYWVTNLVERRIGDIFSLIRHAEHTEGVVKELEDDFGILDFEGRSFPGWHHHMTMVSAAYAFSRLFREKAAYTEAEPLRIAH